MDAVRGPADRLRASAEWRLLASMVRADRRLAAAWWTLIVLRGVLPAVFVVAMGALVGAVQSGGSTVPALVVIAVVFVVMKTLWPLHEAVGTNLGDRTGSWLRDRLMHACLAPAGLAHLERPDLAGELSSARDFDLGITAPPLGAAVPQIESGFVAIVGALAHAALLARYRWWAAAAVAGAWASTHVLLRESAMWRVFGTPGIAEEQRHVDYAYRLAVDAPAAKEIRLFGLAGWAAERFAVRRRRLADLLYRERRLRQRPLIHSLSLIILANAAVFWSLARNANAGALTLQELVVFAQAAVGTSVLAFGELDWWFRGSAQPIPRVLDLADAMTGAGALPSGTRPSGGMPAHGIEFRDVHFAYPTTGVRVLEGFQLTIPAGRSLAIVGPNGAGKTTIAKLVCRLYDPQAGAVLVDGLDLREFDVDAWRGRLAAVFQDFVRYELPMRDNVAPGGAPDAEIERALERARASGLAELGTVLSRAYEGGTDFSGGQWQRIALARALCAVQLGAGVVLLDEPTAQLDVRGEAEIFDRLLEATRGITTILISHRFSTVRHADAICVVEHGRVVEQGTHDELMAAGGRYRTMFDLQASRFTEEPADG